MLNKKTYKNLLFFIIILSIIFWSNSISRSQQLNIAVTIVPQKEMVKKIAGQKISVTVLIPPGYSPGNYAPRPSELTKLSDAKIYFSIGVPTDIQNILPKIKQFNSDIKVIRLDKMVSNIYPDRKFTNGSRDQHIWLSLKRTKVMAEIIRDQLIKLNPDQEGIYKRNTNLYIDKIEETQKVIKRFLKDKKGDFFLVYHPSYGYFAEEFGLKMVSIEEDGKEATAKQIQKIIDFARENNINKIFYQASIDSRQTKAIAEEINAELIGLNPLAENHLINLVEIAKKIAGVKESE